MRAERYEYYKNKTIKEFDSLVKKTQGELDASKSKGEDLYILNYFWGLFMPRALRKGFNSELFLDDQALMPMPESVCKQFVSSLFTIKHLDLLYDLGIYDGLEDFVFYKGHPYAEDGVIGKRESIKSYNEQFEKTA